MIFKPVNQYKNGDSLSNRIYWRRLELDIGENPLIKRVNEQLEKRVSKTDFKRMLVGDADFRIDVIMAISQCLDIDETDLYWGATFPPQKKFSKADALDLFVNYIESAKKKHDLDSEIESNKQKLERLKEKNKQLQTTIRQLETEIDLAKEEKKQLRTEFEFLRQKHPDLPGELRDIQTEIEILTEVVQEKIKELAEK